MHIDDALRSLDDGELPVFVGPTASGKTAYAVRAAEALGGEIVSADSVQVYRHFDIGTGKPTAEERARATHHLIDIVEPWEALDAARFAELADDMIASIRARGRLPIVCGGSYLWIRALVYGLAPAPPADEAIRSRHRALAEERGRSHLHEELARVDPDAAARLSPNDLVRVSRALEVYEQSGKTQSAWHAEHGFREPRHRAKLFGIERTREELDRRIVERARLMFEAGWLEEVRALLGAGHADARAMGSVGYRQIREALAREPAGDTERLLEDVVRATRVFARRQRTWLRDEPVTYLRA